MDDKSPSFADLTPEMQQRILAKIEAVKKELEVELQRNVHPQGGSVSALTVITSFLVSRIGVAFVTQEVMQERLGLAIAQVAGACESINLLVSKLENAGIIAKRSDEPLCH